MRGYLPKNKAMRKSDAIHRPIDEGMVSEAKKARDRYGKHGLASTRLATESNNVVGDLAHQVAENFLEEIDYPHERTRTIQYEQGDPYDLKFDGETWDVKGTMLPLDHFYVFDKELKALKYKDSVDNFLFIQISRDYTKAQIFGYISVDKFREHSRSFPRGSGTGFKYNNWGIPLYRVKSFKSWFLAQPASVDRAMIKEKLLLDTVTKPCNTTDTMINNNSSLVEGEQPREEVSAV